MKRKLAVWVLLCFLLSFLPPPPAAQGVGGGLFRMGGSGGGGPEADPNALHKSGGTMTGTITGFSTVANGNVLTIPACADDPNCRFGSVRFLSKGPVAGDNGSWYINNTSADPNVAAGADHVLGFNYNLISLDDHGSVRELTTSHTVRVGFESRFANGLPATDPNRGLFEFNIDIDPNINTSVVQPKRPFAFHWDMQSRALSTFQLGVPQDPNTAFYVWGNAANFWMNDNIFQLADVTVTGLSMTDPNSQGRIVIDPGFNANTTDDRAFILQNQIDGPTWLRSSKNTSGANMQIAIGYRPTGTQGPVVIGEGGTSQPGRLIIRGSENTYQLNVLGHSTQSVEMIRAARQETGPVFHEIMTLTNGAQLNLGDTSDPNHAPGTLNLHDSDTDPACGAGEYKFYSDTSETKMKLCNNGTRLDSAGVISGSASLNFADPNIVTVVGNCETLTIGSVTGAVSGDVVSLGVPNGVQDLGYIWDAWVSANDTVSIRLCCSSGTATDCDVDPPASTFKVRVFKP